MEAMERLRRRYLNIPLEAVTHPVSTEVLKVVQEEQVAADKALEQKKEDIEELIKPAEEKLVGPKQAQITKTTPPPFGSGSRDDGKTPNLHTYGIGAGILLIAMLGIFGINSLIRSFGKETPIPTLTSQLISISTMTSVPSTQPLLAPANTETLIPPTSIPTLGIGSTLVAAQDGMTLLYVPAGEFIMGSDNSQAPDEIPAHGVYLDAFWIDQTEVTNAMYSKCVNAGKCNPPSPSDTDHFNNIDYANHPVAYVSWDDASAYCSWAVRRLPTEAEWEKAARGTDARVYPWGNDAPNSALLNYNREIDETTEVRSYPDGISPYSAYDMAGNVWEWVNDWYDVYPGGTPSASSDFGQNYRVHRCGSWLDVHDLGRSSERDMGASDYRLLDNLGFRCALDVSP